MEIEPQYQDTLDYLYSYIDYSLKKSFRYSPDKFDLGRMRDFMTALGNPEREYKILHVAGTKGKGSVSALCASAIQASGARVGLYTSPHLQDYAERIQVDGVSIPHADLVALVEGIKPLVAASPAITTFEITTALAFLYFARCKVDTAVLEVGLGGRLDATNVCTPAVTVITSISYDHTDLLGETLAEIAGEKAGIIKPGIPVVVSPQNAEALQAISAIAEERQAPLIQVREEYHYQLLDKSLAGQSFQIWHTSKQDEYAGSIAGSNGDRQPARLTIPLLGAHQLENAATAYAALQVAHEKGIEVDEQGILDGFKSVVWPGRFEILRQVPPLIIDSAHNRDSAHKLQRVLADYYPGLPVILVFGASEDKDIKGMFTELQPQVTRIVATKSTHPRAADPDQLVDIAQEIGVPAISTASLEIALDQAELLAEGKAVILVSGSIFVAAAARSVWQERARVKDFTHMGSKL
jgi:dihydrofolate synthase/folylpolyglutamate synthase